MLWSTLSWQYFHWSKQLLVLMYALSSDKALPVWPRSLFLQLTGIHPPTRFLVNQVSVCCQQPKTFFLSTGMRTTCGTRFEASCCPVFLPVIFTFHPSPHTLSKPQVSRNLEGRVRENNTTTTQLQIENMLTRKTWRLWPAYVQGEEGVMKGRFSSPSHFPGSHLKPWPYTKGGETSPANKVS